MLRILNRYYPIRNLIFFLVEGVLIFLAVLTAAYIRFGGDVVALSGYEYVFLKALLVSGICQVCLYYNDLYDFSIATDGVELVIRLLQAIGASYLVLAVIFFLFPGVLIGRGIFLITLFFLISFIVSWRLLYNWVLRTRRFDQKVLIVGAKGLAHKLSEAVRQKRDSGFEIVGFADREGPDSQIEGSGTPILGSHSQIWELVNKHQVQKIVVALEERRGTFPDRQLLKCRLNGIDIEEGVTFYERVTGKITVENVNPSWLIFSPGFKKTRIRRSTKRLVGIIVSALGVVLALPVLAITAVLIKLESRGPVLFKQERVGENGTMFNVYKFRSMVEDAEADGKAVWAQEDDPRITRVGRMIRKVRVDEIPQLINVLKGDMSFVGPRPERPQFVEELEQHIPYYSLRHSVKPGITGWAQVMYPYGSSIDDAREKLHYDLYYIKNMSLVFDLYIIMNTVKIVLFGRGAR